MDDNLIKFVIKKLDRQKWEIDCNACDTWEMFLQKIPDFSYFIKKESEYISLTIPLHTTMKEVELKYGTIFIAMYAPISTSVQAHYTSIDIVLLLKKRYGDELTLKLLDEKDPISLSNVNEEYYNRLSTNENCKLNTPYNTFFIRIGQNIIKRANKNLYIQAILSTKRCPYTNQNVQVNELITRIKTLPFLGELSLVEYLVLKI